MWRNGIEIQAKGNPNIETYTHTRAYSHTNSLHRPNNIFVENVFFSRKIRKIKAQLNLYIYVGAKRKKYIERDTFILRMQSVVCMPVPVGRVHN